MGGTCAHAIVPDGSTCGGGASRLCVSGECVARACGDGWREVGSSSYAREGCDHGLPDAFCDATCMPTAGPLAASTAVARADLAVAIDDAGRVLVVTVERDADAVVWARTYDAHLVPLGAPFELVRVARADAPLMPAATGLAGGGWAFALVVEPDGIQLGVLDPDASAAVPRVPWIDGVAQASAPRLASVPDGDFVAVAADLDGTHASRGARSVAWIAILEARGSSADAAALRDRAAARIRELAERIEDPRARRSFLENVPGHRLLLGAHHE